MQVRSRLRTDFFPSTAEKLEIHLLISTRQERIQVIEDEIARLRTEQDELQSFIDDHLTLVSPIRQVPVDVLQDIFHCCIPEHVHELPTPRALDAPLLLTGVCRLWRKVAITTPKLWNRVHIALPSPKPGYSFITPKFRLFMHLWGEGVQAWLQRSGSMPLLLSISSERFPVSCLDTESHVELATFHGNVAQQLLSLASRWKSLSLDVPDSIRGILTVPTVESSSLKELKSRRWHLDEESPEDPSLKAIIQSAPSLNKLDMDGPPLHLPVHWNRLTEVVLYQSRHSAIVTLSQAFQVLAFSCSSLRHCTLALLVESPESNNALDTFPSIVLPNLHTLNIHVNQTFRSSLTRLRQALDSVHAPRLTDFYFGVHHITEHLNLLALLGFIERSGCALRSFVLDKPLYRMESLTELLTLMPSLRQFKLQMHGTHDAGMEYFLELIRSFTPSLSNNNVLCPNLESLCMACRHSCAVPILALAEARSVGSGATQKLKRLQVDSGDFAIEETGIPLRLEELRKGGMVVRWTTPPLGLASTMFPRQPELDEYVHSAERWWPNDHVVH